MGNYFDASKLDEYLIKNVTSYVDYAKPKFTSFLDERQQTIALQTLTKQHFRFFSFFGGSDDCNRKMLGFFDDDDFVDFPIVPLKISYNGKLSHGDFLGAIMGIQLKRECIGDIIVDDGFAVVFVQKDITNFLMQNLIKVGSSNVIVELMTDELPRKVQHYEDMLGTVASMRLDCIVSLLINKSRTIATQKITSRQVTVNCFETTDVSKHISNNDVLVVRGSGKFLIETNGCLTKKSRFHIVAKKFI